MQHCRNCGYALWPSVTVASAALKAWKEADPEHRMLARPYDRQLPGEEAPPLADYDARAHELGIHVSPRSNYPFVICLGLGVAAFAAVPLPLVARIVFGAIGAAIFLFGVFGWVVLEDTRYFPVEPNDGHEAHH